MKLGLLGGTFNPVHLAHLRIAEEAREGAGLDQVLFIPAADPPHKPLAGDIPFRQRREMVQLAIAGNPLFGISDIEARRGGKSYTVETLAALREEQPGNELHFIIGGDSFLELGLWHRYAEIFELASLVVIGRPGREIADPLQQLPEAVRGRFSRESADQLRHSCGTVIRFVAGTQLDISSSRLRELLAAGRSIRYLVPPGVENYIAQKGLYRS
ncbi:nicotinate-nucleotide adenylyltransferase [Trichlorobacter ammonificans]|uniref:Probable nicotinate-nucleotide adenylyltransferase n=1 Tax=Trichlorobacter ammonificans TaxID=2916410 RepID=A0ABM9DD50_9BACT|nr:nicotinate-nucleotide adenylyltransferase [Trichlorobacter ammonificans]CAH2032703.1 putative nicotinate-nucleotide adenylyltransferase [Trichlorobacter ammonificans]